MQEAVLYLRQPGPGALESAWQELASHFDSSGIGESGGWVAVTDDGEPIALTIRFGDYADHTDADQEDA